jgi:4-hydroxy-L-threonine phosphate dehydrogenase PdxA
MMFASPAPGSLRLVLTTIHVPIAEVPRLVTPVAVADAIVLCAQALRRDFGVPRPCIAVCGLNPHAGEAGAFGHEEADAIVPGMERALAELRASGPVVLTGPAVPDAVFRAAVGGAFDAVVAQYHDQGLIPFKLRHFDDGVNVTLGLPFVRTSPDHGTAHDIAGRGLARPGSMLAALDLCAAMVQRRVRKPGE